MARTYNFSFSGRRLRKQTGLFGFVQEWKGKGREGKGQTGRDVREWIG
jgi:hypothetical protein